MVSMIKQRETMTPPQHSIIAAMFSVAFMATAISGTCYDIKTSEGLLSLEDGETACAALQSETAKDDIGRTYFVCTHNKITINHCPDNLRWDNIVGNCVHQAQCSVNKKGVLEYAVKRRNKRGSQDRGDRDDADWSRRLVRGNRGWDDGHKGWDDSKDHDGWGHGSKEDSSKDHGGWRYGSKGDSSKDHDGWRHGSKEDSDEGRDDGSHGSKEDSSKDHDGWRHGSKGHDNWNHGSKGSDDRDASNWSKGHGSDESRNYDKWGRGHRGYYGSEDEDCDEHKGDDDSSEDADWRDGHRRDGGKSWGGRLWRNWRGSNSKSDGAGDYYDGKGWNKYPNKQDGEKKRTKRGVPGDDHWNNGDWNNKEDSGKDHKGDSDRDNDRWRDSDRDSDRRGGDAGWWNSWKKNKSRKDYDDAYYGKDWDKNHGVACDCQNVLTSEGVVFLENNQRACAHLYPGETAEDKGKRFIFCHNGYVYPPQDCPSGLRFDTVTGVCNWPQFATCKLDNVKPDGTGPATTSPQKPSTLPGTLQPTTTKPPNPATTAAPAPQPSGPCRADNCKLPNCFCYGTRPAGVSVADTPQFIMLTFDDAVTTSLYNNYFRALMVDYSFNFSNPDGCRPRSTLYVSHQDTDYDKVKILFDAKNEIGSHTIHHKLPQGDKDSDYPEMVAEIQGVKDEVNKALGDQNLVNSIIGFRAPYLRAAGDVMYNVLRDYGFLYDSSVLNIEILSGRQPLWPFTFDYLIGECTNPPCPTKSYPGLWEVPLNGWIGDDGSGCSMVDACVVGKSPWTATEQEWYNFYNRNFKNYFYPIKVPMPIFTHGTLFTNFPNSYPALGRWLHDVLISNSNVWLVTPTQVIQWMRNSLTNSEMLAQKWGCW